MENRINERDCVVYKVDLHLVQGDTTGIDWSIVQRFGERIVDLAEAWELNYITGRKTKTDGRKFNRFKNHENKISTVGNYQDSRV
jgi:hypothetical protein